MEKARWTVTLDNYRAAFTAAWEMFQRVKDGGKRWVLELRPETRSEAQNRRMWPMLEDVSRQVDWHGEKLTAEEWKDVFTAAIKRQKVVHGIDGGFVVCGQRTSKMSKSEMVELQDLIEAFGAQNDVKFRVLD